MDKINDELFGELIYNKYDLEGITEISIFGQIRKLTLAISPLQDREISKEQRYIFIEFKENENTIIQKAEKMMLEYYLTIYENYQAQFEPDKELIERVVPTLSTIKELSKLIEVKELYIPTIFNNEIREIGILCDCTWDPSHGLAVKIVNGEVVEVGPQDIIL